MRALCFSLFALLTATPLLGQQQDRAETIYAIDLFRPETPWQIRVSQFASATFDYTAERTEREVTIVDDEDQWTRVNCREVYLPEFLQGPMRAMQPCVLGVRARFDRASTNRVIIQPEFSRYAAENFWSHGRREWDQSPGNLNQMINPGAPNFWEAQDNTGDVPVGPRFPPNDWIDSHTIRVQQRPAFIQLEGLVSEVQIWVWGMGRPYELTMDFEDWRGDIHEISFGRLNYVGWRLLRVRLPNWIPQEAPEVPTVRPVKLLNLKLTATDRVSPGPVYFYFTGLATRTSITRGEYFFGWELQRRRYNFWSAEEEFNGDPTAELQPDNPGMGR